MRTAGSLMLLALAATLIGCAEEAKPLRVADHSSPEAVFAAYNRAQAKRDWTTVFELLSPGEIDSRFVNLAFASLADKDGKVSKIIEKYSDAGKAERLTKKLDVTKLTADERTRLYSSCVTDKKRLFVEVNLRLDELGTERGALSALRKVVRRGRKAKGLATLTYFSTWAEAKTGGKSVTHREKQETEQPAYFIKQGEKWLFATRQEWKSAK